MYTYEQALEASIEYFNKDELAAKVFVDKYALRDTDNNLLELTPTDMHRRLSKEFARIEAKKFKKPLTEDEIFDLFDHFKYIVPQGSPMYGIGNKNKYISIGNCFVIPPPEDSYLGIMNTDTQITQISCRRGGVGWDVSKLRPKGVNVQNAAKSTTGAVEFMKRFSNTIREVGQHGRRGASLQSMSVHHPEIMDFIKVKRDKDVLTGSNISVQFTDEFMKCVEQDKDFELRWPINTNIPTIQKNIKAREIWKEFIIGARDYAEPGAAFIDKVHRESPGYHYGHVETSSNPCVMKGTLINTPKGYKRVDDIKIGDIVSTVLGSEPVKTIEINNNCEVYEVVFSDGGIQTVTENHIYHVTEKGSETKKIVQKKLKDINIGDYVRVFPSKFSSNGTLDDYNRGLKAGILLGDGCYTEKSIDKGLIKIACNQDEIEYIANIKKLFGESNFNKDDISKNSKTVNLVLRSDTVNLEELGLTPSYCESKYIDLEKCNNFSYSMGILDGLLSTDGNVNLKSNHPQLRWDTSSLILAQNIRQILLYIECHGFISSTMKQDGGTIDGRKIVRKHPKNTVTISGDSFKNYAQNSRIAELHNIKSDKLQEAVVNFRLTGNSWMAAVKSVTKLPSLVTTYDLYCEKSDTWITSGYVQRGCGEQYLPNFASCRLIINNLISYVVNPFTNKSEFNFKLFAKNCYIMQRLADDMVDLEIECIDEIINKIMSDPEPLSIKQPGLDLWNNVRRVALEDRRTGCGFTALGDTLAALNIKYGSDASIAFCERLQREFRDAAYESSVDMAEELGAFPQYDKELDIKSEFIQRIKSENLLLYKKMIKYGRRNMVLLTIAPTGSVSIMTQTTSGLEPVFELSYDRRKKGNPNDDGFRSDFIDQSGDHWQIFKIYHHQFKKWMEVTGKNKVEDSPYFKATANDVDWVARIKMQGVLQKYIDNSISVTVNLPNDVSYETVDKIYMTAWEEGCKGCTVYRDGCRTGVLVTETKVEERPKSLNCDVHHVTSKGNHYFVLVGKDDKDKPYEVFAGKNGFLNKDIKTGKIIKKSKRVYKAVFDDEEQSELCPITSTCNDHEEAITRLTSALLRSNANIELIVEQLERVNGDITVFAKCIARVLKKYLPDGKIAGTCTECNSTNIERSEGCLICKDCGHGKCG